jgi:hypothetical protein
MEVGGQRHTLVALLPGKTRYPLYRRLGGPQGRSGRLRKITPPPGFDPRTVQVLARRYTDRAIPAHLSLIKHKFISIKLSHMRATRFGLYLGYPATCQYKTHIQEGTAAIY